MAKKATKTKAKKTAKKSTKKVAKKTTKKSAKAAVKKAPKKKVAKKVAKKASKKVSKKSPSRKTALVSGFESVDYQIIPSEGVYTSVSQIPTYGHMVKALNTIYKVDKASGEVVPHGMSFETLHAEKHRVYSLTGKNWLEFLDHYEKISDDESPFNTWVPSKGEEIGAAVLELLSKFEEIEEEEDEPIGMEGAVMEALEKLATSYYVNLEEEAEGAIQNCLGKAQQRAKEIIQEMDEEDGFEEEVLS